MNLQQFKSLVLSTFIDKNYLVKPRASFSDSGNGLLYSAIYIMMCQDFGGSVDLPTLWWFNQNVARCMYKPGCLMRTPVNSFGQESWDDYLGVLMVCIYLKQTHIARQILWYGITHGFFYCNGPFTKNGFIARFPQVLTLMFIASFPILKYPMYPLMSIIGFFFMDPPVQDDQSGIELQWVFQSTMRKLYGNLSTYNNWAKDAAKLKGRTDFMTDAFSRYYGTDHAFYLYGVSNGI
jgi:hypothetical protein